jgi:hypothetical protein
VRPVTGGSQRFERGSRVLAAALAVGVPVVAQQHWLGDTYFFADDFAHLAQANVDGPGPAYLMLLYNAWEAPGVHLAPGHRLLAQPAADGSTLQRIGFGPVRLDARRPDATLPTWATDAPEVRVRFEGAGTLAATAEPGTVSPG